MKRYRKEKRGAGRAILNGIITAVIIFALLSLIAAFILMKTSDPSGKTGITAMITLTLTAIISSVICTKRYSAGISIVTAAMIILILITVSLISSHGAVSARSLGSYGCYTLASLLSSFIFNPKRR